MITITTTPNSLHSAFNPVIYKATTTRAVVGTTKVASSIRSDGGKLRVTSTLHGLENGDCVELIAFLIARAIKEKGSPAKPYVKWDAGNSLDRTDFVTRVLKDHEQEIKEYLGDNYQEELFEEFTKKTAQEVELIVS